MNEVHMPSNSVWVPVSHILLSTYFLFFGRTAKACRILVSQQVVKIAPPAVQSWSLNHWTAREVLFYCDHFSGYLRANKQNIFSCVCCCLVAKSCLTLCHPMDCSPPGSMEFSKQEYWSGLPFPSPGGSSQSRDRTCTSCIGKQFLYHWATWEAICIPPLKRNVIQILCPVFNWVVCLELEDFLI